MSSDPADTSANPSTTDNEHDSDGDKSAPSHEPGDDSSSSSFGDFVEHNEQGQDNATGVQEPVSNPDADAALSSPAADVKPARATPRKSQDGEVAPRSGTGDTSTPQDGNTVTASKTTEDEGGTQDNTSNDNEGKGEEGPRPESSQADGGGAVRDGSDTPASGDGQAHRGEGNHDAEAEGTMTSDDNGDDTPSAVDGSGDGGDDDSRSKAETPASPRSSQRCSECRQRRAVGSPVTKCRTCGKIFRPEQTPELTEVEVTQLEAHYDNSQWPNKHMCGELTERYDPLTDPHLQSLFFGKERTRARKTLEENGILSKSGKVVSSRQWTDHNRRVMRQHEERERLDARQKSDRKWAAHRAKMERQRKTEEEERQERIRARREGLEAKRKEKREAEAKAKEEHEKRLATSGQAGNGAGKARKSTAAGRGKKKGKTSTQSRDTGPGSKDTNSTRSARRQDSQLKDLPVSALWVARTPARVVTKSRRKG